MAVSGGCEKTRGWIFTCVETLQPTDSGEEAFPSFVPLGSTRARVREAKHQTTGVLSD